MTIEDAGSPAGHAEPSPPSGRQAGVSGAGQLRPRADSLLAFARALAAASTFDSVAQSIAAHSVRVVQADRCRVIYRCADEAGVGLEGWVSDRSGEATSTVFANGLGRSSAIATALRERRPVVADGPTTDGGSPSQDEPTTLVAMPLGGPRRAALEVSWNGRNRVERTTLDDLEFLAELGRQALDRSYLFDRQRLVAHELQSSMLPQGFPDFDGVDMAAHYSPSAVDIEVGGDWYDAGVLGDGRLVMAVGDVVGRGLGAASTMGRLRHAFAALLANTHRVEALTERLEKAAFGIEGAFMATSIFAALDRATGELALLSAGHVPPIIRRSDGSTAVAEVRGLPLCVVADSYREVGRERLEVGDALLLYTDGLVEGNGEDLDDNLARLARSLSGTVGLSAQRICDHVLQQMGADANIDDIALMCLVRT
ncbi:MAG: PP2C family protein-serine/threonine phosphatase [Acidimicrobiales bacterium]|nr:serine/threonine-protein phosphatase [Acidimicrobiales bacterium]